MSELHLLDARGQADLLRTGEVSAEDLVTYHLERIAAHNSELGAFITMTGDQAVAAARNVDEQRVGGADLPAFAGVPIALKDLTATKGVRTTLGSTLMAENVPTENAYVVDLIEQAGFISLGKTNTPEFGLSSFTDNDLVGPARTPWDTSRNAGGSSGGAAAAVSAGLVPLAQGSDGGGSIRIPASSCGVFGFKPSRGRVSAGPHGSDVTGLAVEGPLTRSVRDAAMLLDVMARPMPGDLRPLPPPVVPFSECILREPPRLRIARWSEAYLDGIEVDPACVDGWERTSTLLESLGHEIVDIDNPFPAALEPQFNVIWSTAIAAAPIPEEAEASLRATTRYWRERGRKTTGVGLTRAMQFLEATTRDVLTTLADFDAFLTPTLGRPPQPAGWFTESGDPVEDHWRELLYTPFTALYNMSGQPAASLPLHVSADGLPIGSMIATHSGRDDLLFSLCAQIEACQPFSLLDHA